ncbi:MAG: hypothetical protein BGO55_03305 [Sphingobacteriales bacterium 50-39]|nr:toll/interleukin-1 receptor domain-containing protein [Sphingobacteriales bacterium]OJW55581.1 MAG: hypothetical protein BGO55_03305 [Sphingobacteriales bacterium 50-39]
MKVTDILSKLEKVEISNQVYEKKRLSFSKTAGGYFNGCTFSECELRDISGFFLGFENCTFIKCFINNVNFSHTVMNWKGNTFEECNIRHVNFDEGDLQNIIFRKTSFENVRLAGMYPIIDVYFDDCDFAFCQFATVAHNHPSEFSRTGISMSFDNCSFNYTHFQNSDLTHSLFKDCELWDATLIDCAISKSTFKTSKRFEAEKSAYLPAKFDLATLKKALTLDRDYLKKYFKVSDDRLFDIAGDYKILPSFHSVFISYSFKDKDAAKFVYDYLKRNKISCFLWEEDAPGGQYLEHLMASEIKKRNKIIFLASQNSLRSSACQFELSEGRSKQAASWDEVFVPVYLDRYMFEVKDYQIRPKAKAQEYWSNIQELKSINCIDAQAISSSRKRGAILANILQAITIKTDKTQ